MNELNCGWARIPWRMTQRNEEERFVRHRWKNIHLFILQSVHYCKQWINKNTAVKYALILVIHRKNRIKNVICCDAIFSSVYWFTPFLSIHISQKERVSELTGRRIGFHTRASVWVFLYAFRYYFRLFHIFLFSVVYINSFHDFMVFVEDNLPNMKRQVVRNKLMNAKFFVGCEQ